MEIERSIKRVSETSPIRWHHLFLAFWIITFQTLRLFSSAIPSHSHNKEQKHHVCFEIGRMVTGWRRAFCTSMPKHTQPNANAITEKHSQHQHHHQQQQHQWDCDNTKQSPKLTFYSNPSTPQSQSQSPTLRCRATCSLPNSPKLQCSNNNNNNNAKTPNKRNTLSTLFSPNSPSTFSLLKSTLRLSKVPKPNHTLPLLFCIN